MAHVCPNVLYGVLSVGKTSVPVEENCSRNNFWSDLNQQNILPVYEPDRYISGASPVMEINPVQFSSDQFKEQGQQRPQVIF